MAPAWARSGRPPPLPPAAFVERCLDLAGPIDVSDVTREALLEFAEREGDLDFQSEAQREQSEARIGRMLSLIVASPEYQFA